MLIKESHYLLAIHISNFKSILNCFMKYKEFKYKSNFRMYVTILANRNLLKIYITVGPFLYAPYLYRISLVPCMTPFFLLCGVQITIAV